MDSMVRNHVVRELVCELSRLIICISWIATAARGRNPGDALCWEDSLWVRCHGRAVLSRYPKVVDPLPADGIDSLNELTTWLLSVLDNKHHSGVELPLRVVDVR
jgi:hypothetical protein